MSDAERAAIRREAVRRGFPAVITTVPDQQTTVRLSLYIENDQANEHRRIQYVFQWDQNENAGSGQRVFRIRFQQGYQVAMTRPGIDQARRSLYAAINGMIRNTELAKGITHTGRMSMTVVDTANVGVNQRPFAVGTAMMEVRRLTARLVVDQIQGLLQSDQMLDLMNATFTVSWVRSIRLQGAFDNMGNFDAYVKSKHSIVSITKETKFCFYQCILLQLAFQSDMELYTYYTTKKDRLVRAVLEQFGSRQPVELKDIPALEREFQLSITVFEYGTNKELYSPTGEFSNEMFVICGYEFGDGHVHYIRPDKVGAIFQKSAWCRICKKGYRKRTHKCESFCVRCLSYTCDGRLTKNPLDFTIRCLTCNFMYFDDACCQVHLHDGNCQNPKMQCVQCHCVFEKKVRGGHVCNERRCSNCGESFSIANYPSSLHQCFHVIPDLKKEKNIDERYIYYDYECAFDDSFQHIPVGIVAYEAQADVMFRFRHTDQFLDWLLQKQHKGYTCIAHNGGRYDMHFIKQGLLERGVTSVDLTRGRKFLQIQIPDLKMRFIDSYAFISVPLRAFPKTFGLRECAKSYFPYRFMTMDRLQYNGPMPAIEWFDIDKMKKSDQPAAKQWYDEHCNDSINLYEFCMEYCELDVKLLYQGCQAFRKIIIEATMDRIDPFDQITIAATAYRIYTTLDMPNYTIGVLQNEALALHYQEKVMFFQYMTEQGFRTHQAVRTLSGQVLQCDAVKDQSIVLFRECLWHGCDACYYKYGVNPFNFRQFFELAYFFDKQVRIMQEHGFTVKIVQECEWIKQLPQKIAEIPKMKTPLLIRDAFYGGRTEVFKEYYKCGPGECIQYFDVTSLYSYIMYARMYGFTKETYSISREVFFPIGHPKRITSDFQSLDQYFGCVKCTVIPPKDLYLPLLSERSDGKLMFPTRRMSGTWTTVELIKAEQLGYVIEEIEEILHFPSKSSTLFRSYIERFFSMKLKAAGWSKLGLEDGTDEEKIDYLDQLYERYGIRLTMEDIREYNPGLYNIAKLFLNSLWGKFAQASVSRELRDTFNIQDFEAIIFSDEWEVSNVFFHSHDVRTCTLEKKSAFVSDPKCSNIALATFVTAYARLELYECLEALQKDVLYCDTDSVIFVDRGSCPLVCGPFLGDLTNELDADEHIQEFVSVGPKTYGYRTSHGKEIMKCKGISLRGPAEDVVTFDVMKDLVYHVPMDDVRVEQMNFIVNERHQIRTEYVRGGGKHLQHTQSKRRRALQTETIVDTLPF